MSCCALSLDKLSWMWDDIGCHGMIWGDMKLYGTNIYVTNKIN